MKTWIKRGLIGAGVLIAAVGLAGGAYAFVQVSAFDSSVSKVYDVPLPRIERSSDPEVLARGKHLLESLGGCAGADCHGSDLGGGKTMEMGPLGKVTGPNISAAGLGAAYSDADLFRLLRHGLKKDGRSVRFMPVHEMNWFSDADISAIISYYRTLPGVQRASGPTEFGVLAKVLDRHDQLVLDVARRIPHDNIELAPAPAPTKAYGRFIAKLCQGCHGETMSGGPIPGAPSSLPVPPNITMHETGLKGWSFEDFERLLNTGINKKGKKIDPFMPLREIGKANAVEKRALWAYLVSLPPKPFGNR